MLYFNSYNVIEIAEKLQIPPSSAALYVRSLEEAGLINTRVQRGSRGSMKICSRKNDSIHILSLIHIWADLARNGETKFAFFAPFRNGAATHADRAALRKKSQNQGAFRRHFDVNGFLVIQLYLQCVAQAAKDETMKSMVHITVGQSTSEKRAAFFRAQQKLVFGSAEFKYDPAKSNAVNGGAAQKVQFDDGVCGQKLSFAPKYVAFGCGVLPFAFPLPVSYTHLSCASMCRGCSGPICPGCSVLA